MLLARRGAAARLRRQLHLGSGADGVQGGDRARHRARPGPEAARNPHRRSTASSSDVAERSRSTSRRPRSSLWRWASRPSLCWSAWTELWPHSPAPLVAVGGEHRGVLVPRPRRPRRLDGRAMPARVPLAHPARPRRCVRQLIPGALGIALMSFTETIAAGRAFAARGDPPIDANRELVATGAANLGGALFGAMPAGGGTSQTAVVRAAGGRSQKASLVTARRGGARPCCSSRRCWACCRSDARRGRDRLLGRPDPAGGVRRDPPGAHDGVPLGAGRPVSACWCSARCNGHRRRDHRVADRSLQPGRRARTCTSIGRKRGADVLRPLSPEHPDDETFEGLLIARPEGRLFFVNAQSVAEQLDALDRAARAARRRARHEPRPRHRVLGAADADRGRAARQRRAASSSGWSA